MLDLALAPDGVAAELATDILKAEGTLRCRGTGRSMLPFLHRGCVLWIEPDGETRVGEVVVFRATDGRLVVHRVIRKTESSVGKRYLIRGDNSASSDGWLSAEGILGRVAKVAYSKATVRTNAFLWRALGLLWNHSVYRLRRLRASVGTHNALRRRTCPNCLPARRVP